MTVCRYSRWLALVLINVFAMGTAMAQESFVLPAPRLTGSMSLEAALQSRRSVREFSPDALRLADVGQLLWAAQGITEPGAGLRTAPSAGARYALELYLVVGQVEGIPPGIYHYDPLHHRLERRSIHDVRAQLAASALHQPWIEHNAALVIITGVEERLVAKYGPRASRYMTLEAGHAAQNLLLQATALGVAAVPIGAFDDKAVASDIQLPKHERPLYLLPIGRPREK